MSEKNKKVSKRVFWTRVLCLVLALIMIGSVCYLAVQLIIDSVKEKRNTKAMTTQVLLRPILPNILKIRTETRYE